MFCCHKTAENSQSIMNNLIRNQNKLDKLLKCHNHPLNFKTNQKREQITVENLWISSTNFPKSATSFSSPLYFFDVSSTLIIKRVIFWLLLTELQHKDPPHFISLIAEVIYSRIFLLLAYRKKPLNENCVENFFRSSRDNNNPSKEPFKQRPSMSKLWRTSR